MKLRSLAVCAALIPALAFADGIAGEGRLSITGGWRATPNGYFDNSAQKAGTPVVKESHGGPTGVAEFGYGATANIEAAIDLLVGTEQFTLKDQPALTTLTYGGLVGARFFAFFLDGKLRPSIAFLTGPVLVDVTGGNLGVPNETMVQGWSASLGLAYRFAPNWGAAADYHLLLARGYVPNVGGVNGGGSWFGVGLTYYFAPQPGPASSLP